MSSTHRPRLLRGLTLVSVASMLAVTAGMLGAGTASASTKLTVKYKVTGSTYLKAPNATVPLGPGTLTSTLNIDNNKLTANLALPPATASFKQYGVIPVTAVTEFIQDGKTTGKVSGKTGAVTSTSKIILKLTSLTVAGVSMSVPSTCESASPATVKLTSQKGFNVVKGGKLAGTYTIPKFAGCGLLTTLLNLTIPGSGNTITLKLGKAKVA